MTDLFHPNQTRELTINEIFALIRYKLDDPKQDAIAEIADYLGITPAEASKNFKVGELARKDWEEKNPTSQNDVESYYKSTYGYIYDLMAAFYELRDGNILIINNFIKLIRQVQPKTILDFGGGAGCYTLPMKLLGAPMSYADLQGETSKYAAWRFKKRGLDVKTYDAQDWNALPQFDLINLFSVLEHAYDPVAIMKNIKNHITPGGHVYLQNDFSNIEPMHLEKNLPYSKTFDRELLALGYKILVNFDNGLMILSI